LAIEEVRFDTVPGEALAPMPGGLEPADRKVENRI